MPNRAPTPLVNQGQSQVPTTNPSQPGGLLGDILKLRGGSGNGGLGASGSQGLGMKRRGGGANLLLRPK